jgi:hypothetical protein
MNPEALEAAALLERRGLVTPATARHLRRVATGELVSVRAELRLIVYGGVLVAMAGVGLMVKEELSRLGPLLLTLALNAAVVATFVWINRHAPAFSRGQAESDHPAFDYMVVLVVLLAGADLAYVETTFTPLGAGWPWHLLLVSILAGLAAFRYDSRVVFSLALSTFAAWRGVSVSLLERSLWRWSEDETALQVNAVSCGLAFLAAGLAMDRGRFKAHFEPVATYLGWLLVLGALASKGSPAFATTLLLAGGGLAVLSLSQRRFWLFAMGLVGAYVGLTQVVLLAGRRLPGELWLFWFFFTSIVLVVVLLLVHARLKEAT